jgi:putative Mn2+ efflux pump MntP
MIDEERTIRLFDKSGGGRAKQELSETAMAVGARWTWRYSGWAWWRNEPFHRLRKQESQLPERARLSGAQVNVPAKKLVCQTISVGSRYEISNGVPLMKTLYEATAFIYFVVATVALMMLSILLLGWAVWEVIAALPSFAFVDVALNSISLLIIGFAVVETAKFIAEEEVFRQRELRSALESRRSLTKFVTIVVIAVSLEALVMIFKASQTNIPNAVYAAFVFIAATFALISLGAYQWLSSRIETGSSQE